VLRAGAKSEVAGGSKVRLAAQNENDYFTRRRVRNHNSRFKYMAVYTIYGVTGPRGL